MLHRLGTAAFRGQAAKFQQQAALWAQSECQEGSSQNSGAKLSAGTRPEGTGRGSAGQGAGGAGPQWLSSAWVATCHTKKQLCREAPASCQGTWKPVPFLLALSTQKRVLHVWQMTRGKDQSVEPLACFFKPVPDFSILQGIFPTPRQKSGGRPRVAGHPPCLCMPPLFMLC